MAKATVKVSCKDCGNEIVKSATKRNREDADNWESWAKEQSWQCTDCWKKEQQLAAEKVETELELPELQGSEKQVAWAKKIRVNIIKKLTSKGVTPDNEGYKTLVNVTSASDWINHRDDTVRDLSAWVNEIVGSKKGE